MTKITFDKQREVFNTLGSKQFDSSEPFKAEFLNGGEPMDLSQYNIRFECKKPDGNIVVDDENITVKNICEIEMYLNEQVTVVNGKVDCQFVLVHKVNERQNSTFTFYMDVQQSVLGINGYSHSVITIAEKLSKDVIEARKLHNDLTSDIATGNQVKDELVSSTNIANTVINTLTQQTDVGNETVSQLIDKTAIAGQEKLNLEITIADAIEKDSILARTAVLADTTNVNLLQSVENAQDNINTINATANNSKIILPEHWVGVEPNLTCTWNHRLNTKNISVDIFDEDTNETLFWSVGRPDENNMIIKSKTRRHLRIVLGAKYYSGGDLNSNEEIIEARKGESSLPNKIDKIDLALTKNASDIVASNEHLDDLDINLKEVQDKTEAWDTIKNNGGKIGDITIGSSLGVNSLMPNKEKYLGSNDQRWEGIKIKNGTVYGSNEDFLLEAIPDKNVMFSTIRSSDNREGSVVIVNSASELCLRPTGGTGAGKMDIGNPTTPFKDIFLDGISKETTGYTKLPNGLILQWGNNDLVIPKGGTISSLFTLPVSFTQSYGLFGAAQASLNVSGGNTGFIDYVTCVCTVSSKNQIRLSASDNASKLASSLTFRINWMVLSY